MDKRLLDGTIPLQATLKQIYGSPRGFWWMASQIDPGQSVLTLRFNDGAGREWLCQVRVTSQTDTMNLSFIAGDQDIPQEAVDHIISDLVKRSPKLGAIHLVAEVEHKNPILEKLRSCGFGISAWQDIWKIPSQFTTTQIPNPKWEWCPLAEVDWWQTSQFLHALIPPISHVTDLPQAYQTRFWVCHEQDRIVAFADVHYGPRGIWIQPLFDPGVARCTDLLCDLFRCMPAKLARPIFLSVRSYQSWLFRSIELMGADYLGHQAILIKHMAAYLSESVPVDMMTIQKRKPKPSHPIMPLGPGR